MILYACYIIFTGFKYLNVDARKSVWVHTKAWLSVKMTPVVLGEIPLCSTVQYISSRVGKTLIPHVLC